MKENARWIERIGVPDPFTLDDIVERVAEIRGRLIDVDLMPLPAVRLARKKGLPLPTGLWVDLPDRDLVFISRNTSELFQVNAVLHELGHMLRGEYSDLDFDPELLMAVLPQGAATPARAVAGRSCYDSPEEAAAELFARQVLARVSRQRPGGGEPPGDRLTYHLRTSLTDPWGERYA